MAVTRVQQRSGALGATPAFTSNVTLGNLLVCACLVSASSAAIASATITDSLGNTWRRAWGARSVNPAGFIYWTVSGASGACTLSITPGAGTLQDGFMAEYGGGTNWAVDFFYSNDDYVQSQTIPIDHATSDAVLVEVSNWSNSGAAPTVPAPAINYDGSKFADALLGSSNFPYTFSQSTPSSTTNNGTMTLATFSSGTPAARLQADPSSAPVIPAALSGSTATTVAFSPPAGSTLVLWQAYTASASLATGVTDSLATHLTWTKQVSVLDGAGRGAEIWTAPCPTAQTNMTVSAAHSGTPFDEFGLVVLTGASGSVGGTNTATGTGTAPAVGVTAANPNSLIIGACGSASTTRPAFALAQPQTDALTQQQNGKTQNSLFGFAMYQRSGATGTVTLGATITSGAWAFAAIEILPAATGAVAITPVAASVSQATTLVTAGAVEGPTIISAAIAQATAQVASAAGVTPVAAAATAAQAAASTGAALAPAASASTQATVPAVQTVAALTPIAGAVTSTLASAAVALQLTPAATSATRASAVISSLVMLVPAAQAATAAGSAIGVPAVLVVSAMSAAQATMTLTVPAATILLLPLYADVISNRVYADVQDPGCVAETPSPRTYAGA